MRNENKNQNISDKDLFDVIFCNFKTAPNLIPVIFTRLQILNAYKKREKDFVSEDNFNQLFLQFSQEQDNNSQSSSRESYTMHTMNLFSLTHMSAGSALIHIDPEVKVGARVQIALLESEAGQQLNGRTGTVIKFYHEKDRYGIKIDGEETLKSIKPSNLIPKEKPSSGTSVFMD